MNRSVAEDIAQILVDEGVLTDDANPYVLGTNLFIFEWGTGIDEQILILDSGGFPLDQKDQSEQPTFQILSRSKKSKGADGAFNNLKIIRDFLLTMPSNITINTTEYLSFEELSNLSPVGNDENDRFVYTSNFFTYRNSI